MMRPDVTDDESLQSWDCGRDDEQLWTSSWDPVLEDSAVSSIDNGSAATTATESVQGAPAQRPDDNPESDGGRLRMGRPSIRAFRCTRCSKTFSRRQDLKRHKMTHDGATQSHRCDICKGQRFSRQDAL